MKRIQAIKTGGAVMLLVTVFALMVPQFLRVQAKGKARAAQEFTDQLLNELANNQDLLHQIVFDESIGLELSATFYHRNKASYRIQSVNSYMRYLEDDAAKQLFPELEKLNWDYSRYSVAVECSYQLRDPASKKSNPASKQIMSSIEPTPFFAWVVLRVGYKGSRPPSYPFKFDVDEEETIQFHPTLIAYSPSNGLDSYGEFFASTEGMWPQVKAKLYDEYSADLIQ